MKKRWPLICGGLFLVFLAELISLGYAWTRANLLDQAIIGKKSVWLLYATLLYFGITVFYVLLQLGATDIFTALGQDHIIKWRSALLNALVHDPTVPKESVQSMFTREAVSSGTLFSALLPQAASRLFTAVLPLIILLRIQPQAALTSLLAIPLVLLCQKHLNRWAKLLESRVLDYDKRLSSYLVEAVRGLSVAQLHGATAWIRSRASSIQDPFWRSRMQASFLQRAVWDVAFWLGSLPLVVVYYLGGKQAIAGVGTPGRLLMIAQYVSEVGIPVLAISGLISQREAIRTATSRMEAIIPAAQRIPAGEPEQPGEIVVENLLVKTKHQRTILSDFSLQAKAGELVVITGENGSGKSTLLRALAGLQPPTGGRIAIGGVDLYQLPADQRAEVVGYLPQSVHVFRGTLASNIVLDKPMDTRRLSACVEAANLNDLLAGYKPDELLERDRLSGGQAQRLGFARLLYRDNPIWLLDEPVAHLDAVATEKLFYLMLSSACVTKKPSLWCYMQLSI